MQDFISAWHRKLSKHSAGDAPDTVLRAGHPAVLLPVWSRSLPGQRMCVCVPVAQQDHCQPPALPKMALGCCCPEPEQSQNRSWLERPEQCRAWGLGDCQAPYISLLLKSERSQEVPLPGL